MNIKNVEGIIFNTFDCKDNDIIVDVITKNHGFIKLYVKGAKAIKNANFFTYKVYHQIVFELNYQSKQELQRASNAQVINSFNYTKLSYQGMNSCSFVSELLLKIKEVIDFKSNALYELIINYTRDVFNEETILYHLNTILLYTLDVLGIKPILDKCLYCSSKSNIVAYSINDNGFVCQEHNKPTFINEEALLKYLYYLDNDDDLIKKDDSSNALSIFKILYGYVYEQAGLFLISYKYLIGGSINEENG
ncbi:MAG: DNA repair protein RecO [Bacilli bacterium]